MPRYAIRIARPDHVLPVRDMPAVVLHYVAHDYVNYPVADVSAEEAASRGEPPLAAFVATLRAKTSYDFEP